MPQLMSQARGSDIDEEIDMHFSGMISAKKLADSTNASIIDSGASDHMTPHVKLLSNLVPMQGLSSINLPTGDTVTISNIGKAHL